MTSSVSGRIVKGGEGVFGAHVVAFDPGNGEMVGNFSLSANGQFSIAGLKPGPHVLRVEPIDDGDTDSFFELSEPTDVNFRTTYYQHLVIVRWGGDCGAIEVAVVAMCAGCAGRRSCAFVASPEGCAVRAVIRLRSMP